MKGIFSISRTFAIAKRLNWMPPKSSDKQNTNMKYTDDQCKLRNTIYNSSHEGASATLLIIEIQKKLWLTGVNF